MNHTNGPWQYRLTGPAPRYAIVAPTGEIAMTYGQPEQQADARLIAAAPDLVAVVRKLVAHGIADQTVMDAARAALAKIDQ